MRRIASSKRPWRSAIRPTRGLRDEVRARPGDRRSRSRQRRCRSRPRRVARRPGQRARGQRHRRIRPDQGALQRRDHPAQHQPGRLSPARRRRRADSPLFDLEQIDPVRVFVGVPELASFFVHEGDTALIRFQAIPGSLARARSSARASRSTRRRERSRPRLTFPTRTATFIRAGTSPSTIVIDRKQVWMLPSNAIGFEGGQNYFVYFRSTASPSALR